MTVTNVGVALGADLATVTIPLRGASAQAAPFISVFQLGSGSGRQTICDPLAAAADLVAVGAATDVSARLSATNSTLYFGIATARSWPTPHLVSVEVLIDTNRDGVVDWTLFNASDAGLINRTESLAAATRSKVTAPSTSPS